jgi:hypothetical protein
MYDTTVLFARSAHMASPTASSHRTQHAVSLQPRNSTPHRGRFFFTPTTTCAKPPTHTKNFSLSSDSAHQPYTRHMWSAGACFTLPALLALSGVVKGRRKGASKGSPLLPCGLARTRSSHRPENASQVLIARCPSRKPKRVRGNLNGVE